MPKYTLYVDVWLLRLGCNFLFEYLLLWATATITGTRTSSRRLFLASLVGTAHYFLYLLASLGLIPFYGLLRFLPVILIVSLSMLIIAFRPPIWSRLMTVAGYFYAIGFVAAGAGMATAYLVGHSGAPQFTLGTLVSILTILIIAELGWGIVHERMVKHVYQIPVEISCDGVVIKVPGLVDTGNNLKDPLNRQPVIIVEQRALNPLLPLALQEIIGQLDLGELEAMDRLADLLEWQTRVRLIPFSSIGKKNGLLVGFRPDEIKIANQPISQNLRPTIAIHPHNLDPKGEYAALVPPTIVENFLGLTNLDQGERGESHASATPSDF